MLEPQSVDQVLRVLELARENRRLGFSVEAATSRAIHEVAKHQSVRYQTIGDGCRRRLGLKDMSEFHRLVSEWLSGTPASLRHTIKRSACKSAAARIDGFFATPTAWVKNVDEVERARIARAKPMELEIPGPDARMLRVLAQIEDVDESTLALELLNTAVRDRFRAVLARSVS